MKVDGFDWDSGNSFKNEAKHGISREAIEAFFGRKVWVAPDPKHPVAEDRFLAIGHGPGEKPMIVGHGSCGERLEVDSANQRPFHACEGDCEI